MSTDDSERLLYQMVKSQLGESPSIQDAENTVSAVAVILKLEPDVIERVISAFRAELVPISNPAEFVPRLFVDWGDLPRVGYQCRPEFSLICPSYSGRPDIQINVDRDLDHDAEDSRRRPQHDDDGLWSFHVPFRMTSEGLDCRPGQYLIEVEIAFRDVTPDQPRFYRCRIRLNVSGNENGEGGVLEIDGDGQSIVNLQGYNLKQFSKVVLKGGQDSVINLANSLGDVPTATGEAPPIQKPQTTFEYQLKVDQQKQSRLPKLAPQAGSRAYLQAAGFFFEDGRRTLIMTRPRITFGRSRDNDVVIRFLPRSEENDNHSKNISRTHCIAELTPEGIEIQDESRSGLEVNYSVVDKRIVIPAIYAGDVTHVELGVTGVVPKKFELEMLLLGPDKRDHRDELEYWDELVCEIVGGRLSRLAREALDVGIDAVRWDRVTSLAGEESYVHLFREAYIGGSPNQSAILLRECGSSQQARLLHIDRSFWLEPLPGGVPVTIDGTVIVPRTLVSLSPGMEIKFGSELARFDQPAQIYLD